MGGREWGWMDWCSLEVLLGLLSGQVLGEELVVRVSTSNGTQAPLDRSGELLRRVVLTGAVVVEGDGVERNGGALVLSLAFLSKGIRCVGQCCLVLAATGSAGHPPDEEATGEEPEQDDAQQHSHDQAHPLPSRAHLTRLETKENLEGGRE
jgi:hypothetical protein